MSAAEDDLRTLEIAQTELGERLKRQGEEIKALDTKAQVVLAFAVGALTFVFKTPLPDLARWLTTMAFVPALIFGGIALSRWTYDDPVVADELVDKHIQKGQLGLLGVVLASHRAAINYNAAVLDARGQAFRVAVWSLAVAVAISVCGMAWEAGASMGDEREDQGTSSEESSASSLSDLVQTSDVMSDKVQKDATGSGSSQEHKEHR